MWLIIINSKISIRVLSFRATLNNQQAKSANWEEEIEEKINDKWWSYLKIMFMTTSVGTLKHRSWTNLQSFALMNVFSIVLQVL